MAAGESTAGNLSSSATAVGYTLAASPATVSTLDDDDTWPEAYAQLFRDGSDLALARAYRDRALIRSAEGRRYAEALYRRSGAALAVLLRNPGLLREGRALFAANRPALAVVVAGEPARLAEPQAVVALLERFADRAPAALRELALEAADRLDAQAAAGEPFLGFELR